jgi:hypothetical protein
MVIKKLECVTVEAKLRLLVKLLNYELPISVSIAVGYGLKNRGLIPNRDNRLFCTPQHSHLLGLTQLSIQ